VRPNSGRSGVQKSTEASAALLMSRCFEMLCTSPFRNVISNSYRPMEKPSRRSKKQDIMGNIPQPARKSIIPRAEGQLEHPVHMQPVIRPFLKPYSLQIAHIRSKRCLNTSVSVWRGARYAHQPQTGAINLFIRFKAPQEKIECYQLRYRLIGLSLWSMMGRCNSGWHHIDSLAALRVSCHFTAGDLCGLHSCSVYTETPPHLHCQSPRGSQRPEDACTATRAQRLSFFLKIIIYVFLCKSFNQDVKKIISRQLGLGKKRNNTKKASFCKWK